MVSLWGSKNGEDQNEGDGRASSDGDNSRQASRHGDGGARQPDERTRLLPPRNDGYLHPDDPAVSTSIAPTPPIAFPVDTCPTGVALQPMVCESLALHLRSLPHYHLPVVGAVTRFHLRQPANDALTRFGLLRLRPREVSNLPVRAAGS